MQGNWIPCPGADCDNDLEKGQARCPQCGHRPVKQARKSERRVAQPIEVKVSKDAEGTITLTQVYRTKRAKGSRIWPHMRVRQYAGCQTRGFEVSRVRSGYVKAG